ncbi:hypothetical protein KAFR_0B01590 [Kazachstania africana CBS 2517]|uniref:Uncharacterized protein n=1 Tax=Kazachstania africana (strain ATCC 22294 / BCRC 22015 / CBS 2517 / CECT 1963 / NBRC 1671 / NRRL Y-8276) TaxID=1071382 RepID=H2AQ08_KAZAF|nr:hypothetical protein KAFR_0B01590 [Kazachstania africana CBS 2517]CCF56458.1 hypothetical protein KAFR_0B01590 [Kazachstania africana CBS 2517]
MNRPSEVTDRSMPFKYTKPLNVNGQRTNIEGCPNTTWMGNRKESNTKPNKNTKFQTSMLVQESNEPGFSQTLSSTGGKQSNMQRKVPDYYHHIKNQNSNSSLQQMNTSSHYRVTDSTIPQYSNALNYTSHQNANLTSGYSSFNAGFPYQSAPAQTPHYTTYPYYNLNAEAESDSCIGESFPVYFDPRSAANMSHKEKVNNWIDNIPIYEIDEDIWGDDCFTVDYSVNWDEQDFDNHQKYSNNVISNITSDEVLFMQSKKIDSLVRRMYYIEQEININVHDELAVAQET